MKTPLEWIVLECLEGQQGFPFQVVARIPYWDVPVWVSQFKLADRLELDLGPPTRMIARFYRTDECVVMIDNRLATVYRQRDLPEAR